MMGSLVKGYFAEQQVWYGLVLMVFLLSRVAAPPHREETYVYQRRVTSLCVVCAVRG